MEIHISVHAFGGFPYRPQSPSRTASTQITSATGFNHKDYRQWYCFFGMRLLRCCSCKKPSNLSSRSRGKWENLKSNTQKVQRWRPQLQFLWLRRTPPVLRNSDHMYNKLWVGDTYEWSCGKQLLCEGSSQAIRGFEAWFMHSCHVLPLSQNKIPSTVSKQLRRNLSLRTKGKIPQYGKPPEPLRGFPQMERCPFDRVM